MAQRQLSTPKTMMITKLQNRMKSITSRLAKFALSPKERDLLTLGDYAEQWIMPHNLPIDDPLRFVPSIWFEDYGLEFNLPDQLIRLKHWNQDYQALFNLIRTDPAINTEFLGEQFIHNHYYPTPDAETYAAMILDINPAKIIEVGSGFSTLIARKAIEYAGLSTTITVIDPSPRTDVTSAADNVILKFIEDVDLSEIDITDNTLLFIDSSHISRGRGDLPFIYCNMIPKLPSGIFVHVHDVYLPYDYPIVFLKRGYTEQYLLYLTLIQSNRYAIEFTTHYLSRKHPQDMQSTFGSVTGTHNRFFGGSLWFRVK